MLALRSAQLAGLKVPPEVFEGRDQVSRQGGLGPARRPPMAISPAAGTSPVMSAEALLIRQYLGWPRETPDALDGVKAVSTHLLKDQERNIYYWYYATQLLHNMQNAAWKEWNPRIRNGLVEHPGHRHGLRPRELGPEQAHPRPLGLAAWGGTTPPPCRS